MILNLPSNKVIYHYTNFEALENILRSHSLWLTHSSCLNDVSEGILGIQEIFELLKSIPKNKKALTLLKGVQEPARLAMKQVGFYVISFCENGDLLSQWRAYTGNGCGVALGIDVTQLKHLCEKEYDIGQCAYAKKKKIKTLKKVFEFHGCLSTSSDNLALTLIAMTAVFYKHLGFKEERECRMIAPPNIAKKYRRIGDRIVPYHELFLSGDYSWLKEIWIGPCHQQIAIGKAVESILDELKIDSKDKLRYSEIPYRGLKYY